VSLAQDGRSSWRLPRSHAAILAGGFIASRLIIVFAAVIAENLLPRNPTLTSGDPGPILRSLSSWDGWYYLGIASQGYHAAPVAGQYHDYAFLPLYPAIVALLSWPWPQYAGLVAVLVSNIAFAMALVLLYHLGRPFLGGRRAAMAGVLLAIVPFGAAFAMAYAESLFLALSLGAFLAAERDRRALAGILLALACLTRLQGLVLILPLLILYLRRDDWHPRVSLAWLGLGAAAGVAYFAYVAGLTGEVGAYGRAMIAWGRTGLGGSDGGSLAEGIAGGGAVSVILGILFVTLLASVFLLVYARHSSVRLEYALIPVLYLAAVVGSGLIESIGRYAMLAFPYAWILASRRHPLFTAAWPPLSAGLLGLFSLLAFGGYWVP
jgi:mannosyltransferase PIG-V